MVIRMAAIAALLALSVPVLAEDLKAPVEGLTDRNGPAPTAYRPVVDKGGPISFQTATAAKICDEQSPCPAALWTATLQLALDYGAGAVELPDGTTGYTSWPVADLRTYDDQLTAAP